MKKYKDYFLMIAIGGALFCFQDVFVYWFHHPGLSQMELLIAKWPYLLGMVLAPFYIFGVYLRYDAR